MKHNNVIPNAHFRKQWQLRVRTWFWQPAKKIKRRQARAEKARKVFPRPIKKLQPLVRCPSQRYNKKLRLGSGFTREELKAAEIPIVLAQKIGIRVDNRRINKSLESLQTNVARLKTYKSNLILFPRRGDKKPAAMYSSPEECKNAIQHPSGPIMPYRAEKPDVEMVEVTAAMKSFDAVTKLKDEVQRQKDSHKRAEEEVEEPVKAKKKKK